MAKPRYLVGKPGDQKFKRNIPADLQRVAGKTAFVERVRGKSASEIKQQGNVFAVSTEAQLRRFRAARAGPSPVAQSPSDVVLSVTEAKQLAVTYFVEQNDENLIRGDYFSDRHDPDFPDILGDAEDAAIWAARAASGEHRKPSKRALTILLKHGFVSEAQFDELTKPEHSSALKNHRTFQLLCRLLERADVALAERRVGSLNLGFLAEISDRLFGHAETAEPLVAKARPQAKTKTVADLKALFLSTKDGSVTRSRSAQYRIPFRALEESVGLGCELAKIGRDECRKLMEFLPRIPSHVTQHFKNATLMQAAELFREKTGSYADRHSEAQKHVAIIKAAFDLAQQEGWIDRNPWLGLRVSMPRVKKFITNEQTYEPFTVEHLNKLFALPLFTGCVDDEEGCHTPGPNIVRRHRFWAPILALWTGMRMNEILQLEKADIRATEDGILYIAVTDEEHQDFAGSGFNKRVKTENSIRNIPVHPMIEATGFLQWVEAAPDGRLFPEATAGSGEKPSDTYSKRFASNRKAAGVWKPRRLVFHSFRNTFNDALRNASVSLELREAINGWRAQGHMDAKYGKGTTIARMKEAVDRVEYPGLRVDHLLMHFAGTSRQ